MSKKTIYVSVLTVIVALLGLSIPVFAQDAAQTEYEGLVNQINEVRIKMEALEPGQQVEYDRLKAEFDRLNVEISKQREILEGDQETKLKISEVSKVYNDGLNSYKIQRFSDALNKFNEAIQKGEALNNPLVNGAIKQSYFAIGNVYYKQGNFTAMIEPLQRALEVDPNYYGAYNLLGRSYQKQGLLDDAIETYMKSIELNDSIDNILAHFNMGIVYFSKKDYQKAGDEFLHVVEISPSHPTGFLYLGRAYFEMREYANAQNALERSIQINERIFQPHFFLAQVYNRIGQFRSAIEAANNAMKYHQMKDKFGGALIERGKAYVSLGNNALALEDFNAAANDRQYKRNAEYEIEILTKFGGKKGEGGDR